MADYVIDNLVNPKSKAELETLIKRLQEASVIANKIVIETSNIKTLKELAAAQEKYNKTINAQALEQKKIDALNQKMAIDAQKEIDRQSALRDKEHQKQLKRIEEEAKATKKAADEAMKLANAMRDDGSVNSLNAQYKANVKILNDMSRAQRENSKEGIELTARTKEIKQQLDAAGKSIGDFRGKVGSYTEAVEGASLSLGEMRQELKALRNISFTGKSDEEVANLKLRIGELMDKMGDLKSEMQVLGTEKSAVFVSGLKFIAAGVEGVVGSLSLMGVESETIQKLESKMTSLIAVTQSLAEIEDVVSSGKLKAIALRIKDMAMNVVESVQKKTLAISTNALTAAEEAKTIATTKGSIATRAAAAMQWLWNTAILANPIVATIVAIGALTFAIYKLTSAEKKESDEQRIAREIKERTIALNEKWNNQIKDSVDAGVKSVSTVMSLKQGTWEYKEELKKLVDEYDGFISSTDKSRLANASLAETMDILSDAIMKKAITEAYATKVQEAAAVATEAYIKKANMVVELEKAQEERNKTAAGTQERYDAEDKILTIKNKILAQDAKIAFDMEQVNKIIEQRNKFMDENNIKVGQNTKAVKLTGDAAKDALNLFLFNNKMEQEALERTASIENGNIIIRMKAIDDLNAKRLEALNAQRDYDLKQKGANKEAIDTEFKANEAEITRQTEERKLKITTDFDKKRVDARKKRYEDEITADEAQWKIKMKQAEINRDKEIVANAESYKKGNITFEAYEKKNAEIQAKYAKDNLQLMIEANEAKIKILESQPMNADTAKQLEEAKEALRKLKVEMATLGIDKPKDRGGIWDTEHLQTYYDKAKEITDAVGGLFDALTAKKIANLEAEQEKSEEAKNSELERVQNLLDNGTISQANADKQKEKIEKRAEARQKDIEKRKAKLQYDADMFRWKQSLAQIAIETALAVMKVTAQTGVASPFIIPGIIALGAINLAAAIANKPQAPKYKTGTNFHPGGFATVGDGGRELLRMPDGSTYLANDEMTFNAPRGMKVLKNSDTEKVLSEAKGYKVQPIDIDSLVSETKTTNKLLKNIANKPTINRIFVTDNSRYNQFKA